MRAVLFNFHTYGRHDGHSLCRRADPDRGAVLNHRAAFVALLVMAAELREAEKRNASDLARAMEDVNHKWRYYTPLTDILEHSRNEHDVWGKRGEPPKEALPSWEENLRALEVV